MDVKKDRVWINGQWVSVSKEVYEAYSRGKRKIEYTEYDLKIHRRFRWSSGVKIMVRVQMI